MLKDKKTYEKRVRNMVQKYAMEDINMEDTSSDEKEDSFSAMEEGEFEEFSDIDDLDMDDLWQQRYSFGSHDKYRLHHPLRWSMENFLNFSSISTDDYDCVQSIFFFKIRMQKTAEK